MTIKAGDLVMVVRGRTCCGRSTLYGAVFRVEAIETLSVYCDFCGAKFGSRFATAEGRWRTELSRLIRIDPPAEPVSVFDRVEEPA